MTYDSSAMKIDALPIDDIQMVSSACNYLMAVFQSVGGLVIDGHMMTYEERVILKDMRTLLSRIETHLPYAKADSIIDLLSAYNILYRICFYREPDATFLGKCRNRVISEYMNGSMAVSEGVFATMIQQAKRAGSEIDTKALNKFFSLINKWCNELRESGQFIDVAISENYRRLTVLLKENLSAYFAEEESTVKQRLFSANIPADFSALTVAELKIYGNFLMATWSGNTDYDSYQHLRERTISATLSNSDLNQYDKLALQLASSLQKA
jgi:hypothetical protein